MSSRPILSGRFGARSRPPLPVAGARVTTRAPFVRESLSVPVALLIIAAATLPAWALGVWYTGSHVLATAGGDLPTGVGFWRIGMLRGFSEAAAPFVLGVSYFLPLFLTALLVGAFWETVFARLRSRPIDCGILYTAWLFTLLLPAGASPVTVAVGASFAFIVGKLLFGGTGRYLVSPALLGVVFLHFAYPDTPDPVAAFPVASAEVVTGLETALTGGTEALAAAGHSIRSLAIGDDLGAFGATSALAAAAGALFLALAGLASWRIILAALAGSLAMTFALNTWGPADDPAFQLPWAWHLVSGSFAFLVAFVATDPTGAAVTRSGRWIYGFAIGAAAILFRVANSSHPEGALYAVLLASLAAPAIDHGVIALKMRRHRRRHGK